MANKNVKLRIFEVADNNEAVSVKANSIIKQFKEIIDSKELVKDRIVPLDDNEFDTLSSFEWVDNNKAIFGVIMRIEKGNNLSEITEDLYKEKSFSVDKISSSESVDRCKDYYYFLLTNKYLVSNIRTTYPVSRITNYLNAIMGSDYKFKDIITSPPNINISDIKKIEINDMLDVDLEGKETKLIDISYISDSLKHMFSQIDTFEKLKEYNLLSLKLLVTLGNKPKNMAEEDYKNILSGFISPIKEDSNISILTKNNVRIENIDLKLTKAVQINTGSNKKIDEKQLQIEMSNFVKEQKK